MNVTTEPKPQTATHSATRPQTGAEYLESIRDDGREVWIDGQRVKDVTTHPAFRNSARMVARLYDALHADENGHLRAPLHDGTGWTHCAFQAPRSLEESLQQKNAYAEWARIGYGWLGRSPDFIGAAFAPSFQLEGAYFGEYGENAKRIGWDLARRVPFIGHAIVNPPIDRQDPAAAKDIMIRVEEETDEGLVISGAKVVATGTAIAQQLLIAHHFIPVSDKKYAPVFVLDVNRPGVKLFCRRSYEGDAARTATPFDAPLSSRLDENDSILVLDRVLVPWEQVIMYDAQKANTFMMVPGQASRGLLQAGVRLAVKLDFMCGAFMKAVEVGGTKDFRGVQAAVGEAIAYRHTIWAIMEAMARDSDPWQDIYQMPNRVHGHAYRVTAADMYSKIRQSVLRHVASGLIYLPSSAKDYLNPEVKPLLDQYARGSHGISSENRSKILKLCWDAVGSEFASRHELYESNYSGSQEQIRVDQYVRSFQNGTAEQMLGIVDKCMSEYDVNGWTVPDLINPEA
ncbi:4-hydroxyphenylacetate 3-hydroxylase family protein [Pseudoprimorskyibacter insulae]|uniref:4-nitrophenol 2-monooxygenase, oxygenase component n=1 Tax=Pseudoprimorskyibacter insulae TaxID=1695997 RepID=A0A2R8AQ59_9RHOB|nr:4-hydroxyphenylacetate 3-hydroxylase N-terminal domain-containing protein [Pseudoprimorskyibacter insulae]SPF78155.1 4-nitrophenol 2-monooxygenase, oxygenase component [Pseudoprimorskyibacter insulae]